jgi:hypothetical protein
MTIKTKSNCLFKYNFSDYALPTAAGSVKAFLISALFPAAR